MGAGYISLIHNKRIILTETMFLLEWFRMASGGVVRVHQNFLSCSLQATSLSVSESSRWSCKLYRSANFTGQINVRAMIAPSWPKVVVKIVHCFTLAVTCTLNLSYDSLRKINNGRGYCIKRPYGAWPYGTVLMPIYGHLFCGLQPATPRLLFCCSLVCNVNMCMLLQP